MFDLGEIGAAVTLDDRKYMDKLKGLDTASETTFNKIKGYALKAFAAIGGTMFLKSSVKEFNEAEHGAAMYSSVLRANGQEYRLNTKAAVEFSEQMQKVTVHQHDAVLATMRYGLSLGVSQSSIEETTKAAIGLSERYGMDMPTAMKLLVRAENGHTEMLGRMGIQLDTTKSKAEQFQQFLQIGLGSFGMATDATKTNRGALEQLNNTYIEAKEKIGEALAPAITSIAQKLKSLLEVFLGFDKTTISAIIRTGGLIIAIKTLSGFLSGMRALYAGKNILLAANTALLAAKTKATVADTAANIANAASARGMGSVGFLTTAGAGARTMYPASVLAAPAASGGLFGVNAMAAGMAAKGGMMGSMGGLLGTSVGSLAASGSVGAISAAGGLVAATGVLGFAIGKLTADITGLTPVLERTFGSWFHGLDGIEARSADLDKKLIESNKKRQEEKDAIVAAKKAMEEKAKAEKEYQKKMYEVNFESSYDSADAKTKAKMAGKEAGRLNVEFLNAPDNTAEELEKKAALWEKTLAMRKRYEAALEEIDKEREESIKKLIEEGKKTADRKLNYLEAGLRSDGKFDMADEAKLASAKVVEQEKQVNQLRLELQKTTDREKIALLHDSINKDLVELGRLREDAKNAANAPREKYTSSMATYAKDIYGDEDMSVKDKVAAITSLNAENRAIYEKNIKEQNKVNPKATQSDKELISLGKLVKQLEKNSKAEDQKKVVEAIKESTAAIKEIKGGIGFLPDKV